MARTVKEIQKILQDILPDGLAIQAYTNTINHLSKSTNIVIPVDHFNVSTDERWIADMPSGFNNGLCIDSDGWCADNCSSPPAITMGVRDYVNDGLDLQFLKLFDPSPAGEGIIREGIIKRMGLGVNVVVIGYVFWFNMGTLLANDGKHKPRWRFNDDSDSVEILIDYGDRQCLWRYNLLVAFSQHIRHSQDTVPPTLQ